MLCPHAQGKGAGRPPKPLASVQGRSETVLAVSDYLAQGKVCEVDVAEWETAEFFASGQDSARRGATERFGNIAPLRLRDSLRNLISIN